MAQLKSKIKNSFIPRTLEKALIQSFKKYPIITLLGARQTGKSTLVRHAFSSKPYVNLEALDIRDLAQNDPREFLKRYPRGAILDEIQNVPTLFSYLQVTVDEKNQNSLFILTGSHQLALHEFISQSLSGRTAIFELLPLSMEELAEVEIDLSVDQYLFQGFFPRIYKEHLDPTQAYRDYVRTYVERDVRQLIHVKDLSLFRKFLKLTASRAGQILNVHNLCNEVGISHHTAKAWLSILEASYLIIMLQPYYENFGKRVIKSPKLYFTDVGLAAYLLDIHHMDQIKRDPLRGSLIENMVIMELLKQRLHRNLPADFYYYRDNNMNEVDVIFKEGNTLIPIEIKASSTFHMQFLKGLKYFQKITEGRASDGYLIYTGDAEQTIEHCHLLNYKNIKRSWV